MSQEQYLHSNGWQTQKINMNNSSFIPCVQQTQTEEQAIRSTIAGQLEWPPIETTPNYEFTQKV